MLMRLPPSWVQLLCLLPFMASVLLPVGMMPAVSSDGTITLVICTAHGPEERSFPDPADEPEGASSWCPFSLLSAPVLPTAPVRSADSLVGEIVDVVANQRDVPIQRDIRTSRPRGPPSIL